MGCCCGPLPDESCGWPKGTVRAVIALITISLAFVLAGVCIVLLIVYDQTTTAISVLGIMFGVVGTVIGHYFGSRTAESASKALAASQQQVIDTKSEENAILLEQTRHAAPPPVISIGPQ